VSSYKQPRKLNFVSMLFLLAGLAGVYSLIQFGPPYWRKWKVKEVLSEAANKVYPKRMNTDGEFVRQTEKVTVREIRAAGVEDPGLRVEIRLEPRVRITALAEYDEVIRHPLVGKSTTLHFRPREEVPIKPN